MVDSSSQDVHPMKRNIEGGSNSKEGCEIFPISDNSMVIDTNLVYVRIGGSDGHLGKRKRGVEDAQYMEDIQGRYQEGSHVNFMEYSPHGDDDEMGDARGIMLISGRCTGRNPPPVNRGKSSKPIQLQEDNFDEENTLLEDDDGETELLMSGDQVKNMVMEDYEDNLSVPSSAQSNYGKYKDVDPDHLIYLYENENVGGLKSTEELAAEEGIAEVTTEEVEGAEKAEEGPVARYLDKHYKGQIIIDGKNQVDELLLATRMAYFDMASQNKDGASEMIKHDTSVDFLKADQGEGNESSVDCSEDEGFDRDEYVEEFGQSFEDSSVDDGEQPVCDPFVPIPGSPGEIDQQEGQNADAHNGSVHGEGGKSAKGCVDITKETIQEIISDDSEDGMVNSKTNGETKRETTGESNRETNGEVSGEPLSEDIAANTMMDKSAECVFPEEKNQFRKQSRIRLIGAPESVKEDISIEKIGKLMKLQDDVLTVHAFKCEFYLSVSSVLCLQNRKIIGCIINVSSNETEIFYYASVLFPNVKNELTPNIDIYVDKKHAVYMNAGVNICSELFKVFKNPAIPFVFINYKDLYNIADSQLAESSNQNREGGETNKSTMNTGKHNEHTISDWLRNVASSTRTQEGKNANKTWHRNVSSQNATPYDTPNKNNNHRAYGKIHVPPRWRGARNYANVSSRRPSNYRFKNLSYVNSVRAHKMTNLHSNDSAGVRTREGKSGAYVGAPIMNGNTCYGGASSMGSSYNREHTENYGSGTPHDVSISEMHCGYITDPNVTKCDAIHSSVTHYNATHPKAICEQNAHHHPTYPPPFLPPQYNKEFASHDYFRTTMCNQFYERESGYPGEATNDTHRGSLYRMHKTNHATNRTNRYLYNRMKRGPPFSNIMIANSNGRGFFETEKKSCALPQPYNLHSDRPLANVHADYMESHNHSRNPINRSSSPNLEIS
ncbi:hypothetical protein C922_00246 [Plasmodium inui San Antonio 1]|uniref:Uncharacterized protein n=1 Tax=Plasmodium inui San Antonio 1 TaxID=1237626 RepID=W7ADI4_9APIC|nr:hypothetical protein C922_00246 [Plasmodium inui San Antonio 1]EUD69383.1 hypothetical protein C922_00246 [Plasmodium inui San Antonio 1]